MGITELILTALSLSMDASSVGMTNGMTDRGMTVRRSLLIAFFYGFFQFAMPLVGYYASSAFASLVEGIAPWLSFILLAFIGGKMIFDGIQEMKKRREEQKEGRHAKENGGKEDIPAGKGVDFKTLTLQAFATSVDALAVGVTFLALDAAGALPLNVWADCLIIGGVTFLLSFVAVWLGRAVGNKLADKAEIAGGAVLVAIGVKILVDGLI